MNRHSSKTNQLYASNDQIDNNGNNILNNNNNNKLSNAADYNSSNYDRDDSLYDALSFGKQTPFGMDSNNSNTNNNNNNNNANYNNEEPIDDFDSESQDDDFENNSSNNEDLNRGITELEDQTNLEPMNRYSLVDLEYINGDVNYSQDEIENNDNQEISEVEGQDDRHDVASNNAKNNNDTSNNFNSIIKMQDANKTNDLMNTSIDEIILIADNGNDSKQERAVGISQSKIPTPIRQNSNRSSTFCKS